MATLFVMQKSPYDREAVVIHIRPVGGQLDKSKVRVRRRGRVRGELLENITAAARETVAGDLPPDVDHGGEGAVVDVPGVAAGVGLSLHDVESKLFLFQPPVTWYQRKPVSATLARGLIMAL